MNIKEINLTEEQVETLLPTTSRKLLAREGSVVFGAMEENDDSLLALAMVSVSDSGRDYILNHIDVYEGDAEILKPLFSYVTEYCKSKGTERLIARFINSHEILQRTHHYMDYVEHKPLVLNGHRLVYKMSDLDTDLLLKKHGNLIPLLKQVRKYDEIPRNKYNLFFEKMRKVGRTPFSETKDEEFDRYFEYRGGISGYINSSRTAAELLLLADSYVYDKEIKRYAFPAMLASVLVKAKEIIPPEGEVIMQVYEESIYQGVKIMLNEPSFEEMIFEYVILQ